MPNVNPTAECIIQMINSDQRMKRIICEVRDLHLPDCWIGAGFVRNKVWDVITGKIETTCSEDIDVIYFDSGTTIEARDREIEQILKRVNPHENWSVKNQARMHVRNNDLPYHSSEHAIVHWPETATAIAVSINQQDQIQVIAPHGLDDLFSLTIKATPAFSTKMKLFRLRQSEKNWQNKWPSLREDS